MEAKAVQTLPAKRRVNLRLDAELVVWARGYAQRHKLDFTGFITQLLWEARQRELLEAERADAEQI